MGDIMSKRNKSSKSDKIKEMMREISDIPGIIGDAKRKQLELKYGELQTFNIHIKMHNDKINRKNKKNNVSKTKDNNYGVRKETKIQSSIKKQSINIYNHKSSVFNSRKKQSGNIHNPKSSGFNSKNKQLKNKPVKKSIIENLQKDQLDIISKIKDSIKQGYEYIILEANAGNSEIAVKLAEDFEDSIILTANEKGQNKYNRRYKLRDNDKIHLSNHSDAFEELKDISKRKLLIVDDAHRLDENIVNMFSYSIDLSQFEKSLIDNFECKVEDLEHKDYTLWLDFINHLSLNDKWINRVVECIKENHENWICSYDYYNYPKLSFLPLNIGNLAKKYWLAKGEICIFISPTILDSKLFASELGFDGLNVKYIHRDLPFNRHDWIYAKNSVDMSNENNKELIIPVIKEILEMHPKDKGLIYTGKADYTYFIKNHVDDKRLMAYENFNYYKRFQEFRNSSNSVILSHSLEDGIEFPYDHCNFQIIIKQHNSSYNKRAIIKNNESNWYSYKQIINILQMFQGVTDSKKNHCKTYVLDENILKSIRIDILENNFLPKYVLDLIADMDMIDYGLISQNLKKQFGVYYLFDYIVPKREKYKNYDEKNKELSKKIWNYKKYDKEMPMVFKKEFELFTDEYIRAISELSNQVIDDKTNKLALVCVPSSTTQRDKTASVRESINYISKHYLEMESDWGLKKEILNCGDLLVRTKDVKTSHLAKEEDSRPSYGEHMNSIKCTENEILEMDDVTFIILDDISTRGTVMDACEDKLIQKGVKKRNIYKFAIFKTLW